MLKSTIGCLLALTLALSVAGCSKEAPTPAASPAAAPAASAPAADPHPIPAAPVDIVDVSGVERAEGGMTIAEIFEHKDHLAGQPVIVRGKVVKTNPGIMGRNWVHIRDGSGVEGSNDLTVTTVDVLPEIGDTVLVSGTLEANKDFGMGYVYAAIIDEADVTIESNAGY